MARAVHPHAMTPSRPGRTRTASPQAPSGWYAQPRMLRYLLFDATGFVYLLCGFGALRAVWLLGSGPSAWEAFQREYAATARDPAAWDAFKRRYLDVSEAEYQAAVRERRR